MIDLINKLKKHDNYPKNEKNALKILLFSFVLMNCVAYFHAYQFTHFANPDVLKTKNAKELSIFNKIQTLIFGIKNPRPLSIEKPLKPFETVQLLNFPVLLLYGEKDKEVSRAEIDLIYQNLPNKKTLKTYPEAGHENYLKRYKMAWTNDVTQFLLDNAPPSKK